MLQSLDDLTKQFVKMVYEKKGYTELAKKAGGKVFTYGSYRLGVNATGIEI